MKKTIAIILFIFTISIFPSLAEEEVPSEPATSEVETAAPSDSVDVNIKLAKIDFKIKSSDAGTYAVAAFCGHGC